MDQERVIMSHFRVDVPSWSRLVLALAILASGTSADAASCGSSFLGALGTGIPGELAAAWRPLRQALAALA